MLAEEIVKKIMIS